MTKQFPDILAVVDLEGEVLAKIKDFQNYLAASGGDIEPTPPKSMHISLGRFNVVSNRKFGELRRTMSDLYFEGFTVKMGNCLIQPSLKNPQTIWVKVSEGIKQLRKLAMEINKLAIQAGFKRVRGGFDQWIKIAEIKSVKDEGPLKAAVYRLLNVRAGSMYVSTVKLKQEILSTGLITYKTIYQIKAVGSTRFLP